MFNKVLLKSLVYCLLVSCSLLCDAWMHFLFLLSGTLMNELLVVLFHVLILSEVMFCKYKLYHVE